MMLLSRRTRLKPWGPITAPAMMSPNSGGMRILFSNNGAPRMMSRMMRNFSTGSASGSVKSIAVRNIIDDFDLFNRKITKFSPFFLTRGTIFRGVRAERIVFLYAICTGKGNRITSNE